MPGYSEQRTPKTRSIPRKATTTTMTQRGQSPGNVYGNAIAHAREQLQFGRSTSSIEGQLTRKYPSLQPIDIRSAVLAAANAIAAAASQNSRGPLGTTGRQNMPINGGIPSQYQYVVNVTYNVSGSSEVRTRTVI